MGTLDVVRSETKVIRCSPFASKCDCTRFEQHSTFPLATATLVHFSQSSPALSAQAFVVLDLLLMATAFAAARSGNAGLMSFSFGLHFAAALTV